MDRGAAARRARKRAATARFGRRDEGAKKIKRLEVEGGRGSGKAELELQWSCGRGLGAGRPDPAVPYAAVEPIKL